MANREPGRSTPTHDTASRYVFAERPKCPACHATRLRAYRTTRNDDDGTLTRYTRCLICGQKFLLILE